MTSRTENDDLFLEQLLRRALVPKGFRPRTEEGVGEVLDALGQVEISDLERDRVVDKILGRRPYYKELESESICEHEQVPSKSEELVEMFRGEGEEIPPEVAERLRQLEAEATQEPDDEEEDLSDGP